jgi:hypothetical protein
VTLVEAIKSGLPFRRPTWRNNCHGTDSWVEVEEGYGDHIVFLDSGDNWEPHSKDLLANDYVLKKPLTFKWAIQQSDNGPWKIAEENLSEKEIEDLGYEINFDAVKLELVK